ncbi:putative membrane protein [Planomicrobium sp. HSC-17F08]|nr:putative membrane protein [Planomicrobium sp. HSC-17F08]
MKPVSYVLKEKIWIIPAVYSVAAILLSLATFYADLYLVERFIDRIPSIFLTKVDEGQTILGILTAAMLTMTTFTFSTVLVVLTMYTSQFSPRAPENFIQSATTRHVLGIFVGGFIFNMLSLLYMQEDVFDHEVLSTTAGILIVFFCIATFAYYIHFVASNVQVSTLTNKLTADAEKVIAQYLDLYEQKHVSEENWEPRNPKETVKATRAGYIQFIDLTRLMELAEKNDGAIEVIVKIGDYVFEGKPVFHLYSEKKMDLPFTDYITIGDERTADQDLGYAVQKITEVAVRATSPGRQDPNTAKDILIRLGHLLGEMSHLKTDGLVLTDERGNNRLLYRFESYSDILYKTFYQISYHSKKDVSVHSSMTDALIVTAALAPELRYDTIWKIQLYLLEAINDGELKTLDRDFLQKKVNELADITGHESIMLEKTD